MKVYKTEACFSCGRYFSEPRPCENCNIIPHDGVVECIVCTKVIPFEEREKYVALENFSGSNVWKYLKRYCICKECLQRARSGEWKLKLKRPVTFCQPTPDWR
ncbi:MAG: hypothetical protein QXR45_10295 [Candidatus Bathyarchaeia archaeon]